MVASDYDLGEVLRVEQILGGFDEPQLRRRRRDAGDGERRYFVRKYKRGTREREMPFEHALVSHISGKGFDIAARVFQTRDGRHAA